MLPPDDDGQIEHSANWQIRQISACGELVAAAGGR